MSNSERFSRNEPIPAAPSPEEDRARMRRALELAAEAAKRDEVPVGAVITDRDGTVIGEGFNLCESEMRVTKHAELTALDCACARLGGWRLDGCTLYVTLEPCPMCAGALIASRVSRIVFGAKDSRAGALGTVLDLNAYPLFSKPSVTSGVLADECAALLSDFFRRKRK